jgi:hypothetical protein
MAGRIRAFDWASTTLGPIEQWEDTLLTTVNLMLASRHAVFLFWVMTSSRFITMPIARRWMTCSTR